MIKNFNESFHVNQNHHQSKVALIQKTSNLTNIQYPHHQHYKTKRLSLFWILTIQGISYQFTIHPGNSRHYKPLQYIWLFWMLTIQEISYQFTIHPGNSRHYKTKRLSELFHRHYGT